MPDETLFDLRALVLRVVNEATSLDTNSLAEEVDRLTPGPRDGQLRSAYRQTLNLFVQNTIARYRNNRSTFAESDDLREPESDVISSSGETRNPGVDLSSIPSEVPEAEQAAGVVLTAEKAPVVQGKLRNRSSFVEGIRRRYAGELSKPYSYDFSPTSRIELGAFTLQHCRSAAAMAQQHIDGNLKAKARWEHFARKLIECRVNRIADLPDDALAEVLEFEAES